MLDRLDRLCRFDWKLQVSDPVTASGHTYNEAYLHGVHGFARGHVHYRVAVEFLAPPSTRRRGDHVKRCPDNLEYGHFDVTCDAGMRDNILEGFAKNCAEPVIYARSEEFTPIPERRKWLMKRAASQMNSQHMTERISSRPVRMWAGPRNATKPLDVAWRANRRATQGASLAHLSRHARRTLHPGFLTREPDRRPEG